MVCEVWCWPAAKFLIGKPRRGATSLVIREAARRGASLREALPSRSTVPHLRRARPRYSLTLYLLSKGHAKQVPTRRTAFTRPLYLTSSIRNRYGNRRAGARGGAAARDRGRAGPGGMLIAMWGNTEKHGPRHLGLLSLLTCSLYCVKDERFVTTESTPAREHVRPFHRSGGGVGLPAFGEMAASRNRGAA